MSKLTINFEKIDVTVTTAGTAVPISATPLYVTDFEIYIPSANAGANCYVGDSGVDNTWIPRAKSNSYNFTHGTGVLSGLGHQAVAEFDLSRVYVDADSNGDSVVVQYLKRDKS